MDSLYTFNQMRPYEDCIYSFPLHYASGRYDATILNSYSISNSRQKALADLQIVSVFAGTRESCLHMLITEEK